MITTLPLSSLLLSDLNVRKTERDADIAALADDIAARGLKQNLVVVPAHFTTSTVNEQWDGVDRWADKFEVIAGGRRFQAMQLLVEDGRLPADHEVPCLLEDRAEAEETSLSENLHRVAMNPADEFEAFAAIVAQQVNGGALQADAVSYTARRFGVTVRHVEGRLRLAALAPEILEALRTGAIGLESAKAYAGTTDHALQVKVFKGRLKYGDHNPRWVRDELRGKTLPINHPLMTFVELAAYQAEGGRIEAEMFMGTDGEQRVVDVALLEKLARTRAEAMIPAQAKADGYKQGLFVKGVGNGASWCAAPKGYERHWGYGTELSKTAKKKAIGVYAVASDGLGLHCLGAFKPEQKREPAETRDWDAERATAARDRAIEARAARMAVPKFAGTPLADRAFWPRGGWPVEDCDDEHSFVVVWIKVPIAEVEANRADATRLVDEELAAKAAADAARERGENAPLDDDQADDKSEDEEVAA
ncbi:MAG: hypothetical protein FP826_01475 [Sphingomonadales bacterium]|nr:hypothetical protein [Sphingomonadales bacterium]MBU3993732.1 ParB/RepB/Spo0J family partition protein [Alphaproteobacteria bacterium]